ncbi:MAG: 2-methylaconitate cis-trans isomerase PrpF family protein, partial [Aigarchaeota archaeon]|nr:2-methylaconitate cis-trans isomerase PrpF family protein [Aigarchaeota archaeon]
MGGTHKTYPITGTVATGVAAKIHGTIVDDMVNGESRERGEVHIGHPAGVIDIKVDVRKEGNRFTIKQATVGRTARRIMEGYVHVRKNLLE